MIYFDNAATGGYKPKKSIEAAIYAMNNLRANAGRSGHKLSIEAEKIIYSARKTLCDFFGADDPSKIIFTHNCTAALNAAIFGKFKDGDHVITTVTEHNSVLRPLYELKRRNTIELTIVEPKTDRITFEDIMPHIKKNTAGVIVNAVSNVTGQKNDFEEIGKKLYGSNICFIVDGAQAAGHVPINISKQNIDVLCVAGHKGLLSVQGVGAMILGKDVNLSPTVFGGTGIDTFNENMPSDYPERLEAGTLNLPSINSLLWGIKHLQSEMNNISYSMLCMTENIIKSLENIEFLKVFSKSNESGIVSFSHDRYSSQELSGILNDRYDIAVRGGFHCAPLMHKFLKTDKDGLVRVSLSVNNNKKEISSLIYALNEISKI